MTLFDAQLRATALRAGDLEDLGFFGVGGALVTGEGRAGDVAREWAELAGPVLRRMRRAGLAGYAAVGVHPRAIPRRGLEALLAELPEHLGRPRVVAVGPVGLEEGGRREEEVFGRQLELAVELRRPVFVDAPSRDRERVTRRALAMLRDAGVEPGRAAVAADARTARMIRACGWLAAVSLSPSAGTRQPIEEAVRLVRSVGAAGLALASAAGDGTGDLLALPRVAARLRKAGLSAAVVRRVCGANAAAFLGVELGRSDLRARHGSRSEP